jgi:hypothetical protein
VTPTIVAWRNGLLSDVYAGMDRGLAWLAEVSEQAESSM